MSPSRGIVRSMMAAAQSIASAIVLLGSAAAMAQPVNGHGVDVPTHTVQPNPVFKQGLALHLGYHSDYKKATLAYESPKIWTHQFQNGWGRLDLDVELGVSYWKADRSQSMWQLSAIPMLRWWPNEGVYLEIGSGPTVLSRSEFAGSDLGTHFQFGSHLGTGILINDAHRIGIRYSHYSNAGIKKPNPGLDVIGVAYSYQF